MPRDTEPYDTPQPITATLIKRLAALPPPERPREIRDPAAGLILRHQHKTGYLGLYAYLGNRQRERLVDARRIIDPNATETLSQLKVAAGKLRAQHQAGRDFRLERQQRRKVPTLRTYLDDHYGPWLKANRRSGAATLALLEHCFAEQFGDLRLDELTPDRLVRWRGQRKVRRKVREETLNRNVSALHAALNRAVKLFKLLEANPLAGIELAQVDRHRRVVRALTADERDRLLAALRARDDDKRAARARANEWRRARDYELWPTLSQFADALTPAVVTSLETGLRRAELLALRWQYVDLKHRTLRVEGATAKTFETRDVPLSQLAHGTLRDWWLQQGQPATGYVFPSRSEGDPLGSLKKSYQRILAKAKIERENKRGERVNWHSLRHTFGSLLGSRGVDPKTIMELMGHADLKTTQRYLHTDEQRKRAAVEVLGD